MGLLASIKRGVPLSLKKRDGVISHVALKTRNTPFCKNVSSISQEVLKEISGLRDPKDF